MKRIVATIAAILGIANLAVLIEQPRLSATSCATCSQTICTFGCLQEYNAAPVDPEAQALAWCWQVVGYAEGAGCGGGCTNEQDCELQPCSFVWGAVKFRFLQEVEGHSECESLEEGIASWIEPWSPGYQSGSLDAGSEVVLAGQWTGWIGWWTYTLAVVMPDGVTTSGTATYGVVDFSLDELKVFDAQPLHHHCIPVIAH